MKLLGGDKDTDDKSPMDDSVDDGDVDNASADGFNAAADEMFSALETKDVDAFTSALKSCIEMYK